jgi:mono/diheme cytochrome c family protein
LTWNNGIGDIFKGKCAACHGQLGGFDTNTYAFVMKGSTNGVVIVPGNPANSRLVSLMEAGGHPALFSPEELEKIRTWINAGALEK